MTGSAIDAHYLAAQRSFAELARTVTAGEWSRPAPCTPGWTARDLLSHVVGITDDALAGRLDGVTTEPWTAAQVERNRADTVENLLARWDEQAPVFAAAIAGLGERRPPIDCHTHEHDVRHAIGRPGNRASGLLSATVADMVIGFGEPLVVRLDDGREVRSDAGAEGADGRAVEPVVLAGVTRFEVFRSRMGRRSAAQVAGYDWSGPPAARGVVLDAWFTFGPSGVDIFE